VFLDRDGTLLQEVGYLDRLERMRLMSYSVEAIRVLNRAGYRVVVVTNQAGVAHGHYPESFVLETHRVLDERFRAGGARIDAFYYCPHLPEARVEAYRIACDCRKPKSGMVVRAARDLGLDLARSFMVGDQWADVGLRRAAGLTTILVRTGYGKTVEAQPRDGLRPDIAVNTLIDAVSWIVRHPDSRSQGAVAIDGGRAVRAAS
jgi:D-glycero-D-manno-heptose 1,7-bisphosphate phosphatase